jgi:succinyl-CoA:acetate CoA-transferase
MSRINCPELSTKTVTAEAAARHIDNGQRVAMSGFTGSGYPKAVPGAVAARARAAHARGDDFRIELWTGASTAPELDGVLAEANAVSKRLPFQSDPAMRASINSGDTEYVDTHLSHSAQQAWFGFYGNLDVAVVEVAAILPNGSSGARQLGRELEDLARSGR